jgi:hypothetical protein
MGEGSLDPLKDLEKKQSDGWDLASNLLFGRNRSHLLKNLFGEVIPISKPFTLLSASLRASKCSSDGP